MTRNHSYIVLGGVFVVLGVLLSLSGGCHFTFPASNWTFNSGTTVNGVELQYKNTLHYSSPEQMKRLTLSLESASISVEGDPAVTGLEATFEVREYAPGDASLGPAPDSVAVKSASGKPVLVTSAKLRVPPGTVVEVSTSLGSVTVGGISGVPLVSATTNAGKVDLHDLKDVATVSGKSSLGSVSITRASAGDVTLTTDSGEVDATQVTGAKNVKLKTSLGGVKANSVEASESLTGTSDCGSIEVEDVNAGKAKLKTSLGSVTAKRSTFDHVSAHTDSGSVHLKSCTYKTKDVGTDLGRVTEDD